MGNAFTYAVESSVGDGLILPPAYFDGTLEVLFVARGKVTLHTAVGDSHPGEGDLVITPPGIVRWVTAEGSASVTALRFSTFPFTDTRERIDRDLFGMFLTQARTADCIYTADAAVYPELRAAFDAAVDEYATKDICHTLRAQGIACTFVAAALSFYGKMTKERERAVYHNVMRLLPTLDYIDAHFREHISVPDLARQVSVTPDYYTKLFHDSLGMTTVVYINAIRINTALRDLTESDEPLSSVAENAGFSGAHYFGKILRDTVGITPLVFRRMCGRAGKDRKTEGADDSAPKE